MSMKPLNRDEPGCNYTSSNCVIWQGPDIPCIKLCKGDSVSDVVYKLATELCDVLDTLDIDKYDISCLNLAGCAPANFHDFLQALINLICQLQDCCATAGTPSGKIAAQDAFLNQQMPVNPMYYYTDEFGNQITTMTGRQYLTATGNQTATTQSQLDSVTTTVAGHTTQIQQLQSDVAAIPSPLPETVIPVCTTDPPGQPVPVPVLVQNLETAFCALQSATGLPNNLYQAIGNQCVNLINSPTLDGSGRTYGSIPGWVNNVGNVADSLTNMWLFLCDIRAGILNIKSNMPSECDAVQLTLTATISGTGLTLFIQGTIPAGYQSCSAPSYVTITDTTGGSWIAPIDVVSSLNIPYIVNLASTPINVLSNLNISITPCLTDATRSIVCQSVLNYTLINQAPCTPITYTPSTNTIIYNGTANPGTATYTIELWDGLGTVMISSQSQVIAGPGPFSGVFVGLPINTSYKLRLKITSGSPAIDTYCPYSAVSLLYTTLPPVPLNGAAPFVVLAHGNVTEVTGASTFIGSIGTETGIISGITPPQVTGTIYPTGDPAVVAGEASIINAKSYIAGLTPYNTIADAIGGTTITPGYYRFTGGTIDITGTVIFDGLNVPSSVWVLDAATSIAIANGATIQLINYARFENIFFNAGTNLTIGDTATVKGNFLVTGNITVGNGSQIQGRLLSQGIQDLTNIVANNI